MTKASKAIASARIVDYHREHFAKADQASYYTEGGKIVGQFHGRLAEEFGLIGKPATEELIQRLAEGQHPWTGEQLVKHRKLDPMPAWQKTQAAWTAYVEDQIVKAIESSKWPTKVLFEPAPRRGGPKGPEQIHEPARTVPRPEYDEHQKKLIEIHEDAARFYATRLAVDSRGQRYLATRNIGEEAAKEFRLGFAGKDNELTNYLAAKHDPQLLVESGLVYRRESDGRLVDRFRDRLMIPIQDAGGNVVAFAGRRVDTNKARKYINSPTTAIYRKSETIYNAHRAAAEESGRLVVVEGPLDAIQAQQAGLGKVVAASGTALRPERIAEISGHVLLNHDGDEAGKKATERQIEGLLKAGVNVRVLSLEGGLDPDAYIRDKGAEAYRSRVANSKPLITWLGERAAEKFGVGDSWSRSDAYRWVGSQLRHVPADLRAEIGEELRVHLGLRAEGVGAKSFVGHRAAIDVMFAPPKSVSVQALVGGDERIIELHRRAVQVSLDRLEKFVQARHRDSRETSANWVAALFVHDVSRPVGGGVPDPQLHTHSVVFNMTRSEEEGAVRSMDPEWIYRAQSYANAVYMSEVANGLRGFGYQLERGKGFAFEISGYSPKYLLAASKRADQIEKEKERQGVVGAEAGERIALQLREAKQSWEPEALREAHVREVAEYGIDPFAIGVAAQERGGREVPADVRGKIANEAIDYAKSRLYDRQAVNEGFEVVRDALRYSPHLLRVADVQAALNKRQDEFVVAEHYRRDAPGERYTTPEMKAMERESIQIVLRGQGRTAPIVDSEQVSKKEFLARFGVREIKGKKLEITRDQLRVAYAGLTSRNQYPIVAGTAGVGKSTSFEIVAEMAEEHREAGYRVLGMAATSSATNNLRDMGIEAGTLQLHNTRGVKAGTPKTLYLLDEGSLVGTRSFRKFLDTVRPQDRVIIAYDHRQHHSVEAGRIIEELEMAGVETIRMEKIMRQRDNPELLASIEKFRDSFGPRGSQKMIDGLKDLFERCRVWEAPSRWKRFEAIAEFYAMDPERTLVISPDNRSLLEINEAVRERLKEDRVVGPDVYEGMVLKSVRDMTDADKLLATNYRSGDVIRWGRSGTLGGRGHVSSGQYTPVVRIDADRNEVTIKIRDGFGEREVSFDPRTGQGEVYEADIRKFAVGDKIQITRPWTLTRGDVVANRAIGVIRELDETGRGVLEIEGRRIRWNIADMPHIDYGYAMTSYSAQSATVPRVAVHIDTGDTMIRSLIEKPLLYVGASRASEDVAIFTDNRELLLDPQRSPILRQYEKPLALAPKEIEQAAEAYARIA